MSACSNNDCPICGIAEKEIKFYGYGHCNHPICGTCAIKLQKFSKDKENDYDYSKCVICKQDVKTIIITSKIDPFESYNQASLLSDDKFDLIFESNHAKEFYNSIIKISCPQCKMSQGTMEELMKHLETHKRRYCELCVSYRKCLQYELDVFTGNDYHQHRYQKHPKCRFCEIRFYDDSHLIKHVKEKHFLCDICHRSRGFVSFNTQSELLKHYAKDHHVCEICRLNNNINVFESEYHLKTHKVAAHSLSLVSEGLVSVNYGDRDNLRYGARRKARGVNDDVFDEAQSAEIPQLPPTMNSEQEFPRLGVDPSPAAIQQQLGTQSLTLDENDARTAFNDGTGDKGSQCSAPNTVASTVAQDPNNNSIKQSATAPTRSDMSMSNSIAFSLKRSVGNLNNADFPALSGTVATGNNCGVDRVDYGSNQARPTAAMNGKKSNKNNGSLGKDEDFPLLSTTSKGQAPSNPSWGRSMKPVTNTSTSVLASASYRPIVNRQAVSTGAVTTSHHGNRAPREDNIEYDSPELDSAAAAALANTPKVSLMSREEFEQSSAASVANKPVSQRYRQTVPGEHDFPSLNSKSSQQGTAISTTKVGAWGKFQVPSNNNTIDIGHQGNTKSITEQPENKFAIKSALDFPELPFKEVSIAIDSAKSKPKQFPTKNSKKKPLVTGPPTVAKSVNGSSAKHTSTKRATSPGNATKQPESLRGIDYIPSAAGPTRDPIKLVDSTQFSMIKSARDHHESLSAATGPAEFSLDSHSDFPTEVVATSNRYGALTSSGGDIGGDGVTTRHPKTSGTPPAPPKMSSESDFPSLGPARPARGTDESTPAQKPNGQRRRNQNDGGAGRSQPESSTSPMTTVATKPVVSLMDVAMIVTRSEYTVFEDTDARNELMFERVSTAMTAELAGRFLQLANLYRTRQLSVRDYLANVDTEFAGYRDAIATLLPEMCVLLPDIPLQRSLLAGMPKQWIKDLRECSRCDQVVRKDDIVTHNRLAH